MNANTGSQPDAVMIKSDGCLATASTEEHKGSDNGECFTSDSIYHTSGSGELGQAFSQYTYDKMYYSNHLIATFRPTRER